jgi:hypothetical protein
LLSLIGEDLEPPIRAIAGSVRELRRGGLGDKACFRPSPPKRRSWSVTSPISSTSALDRTSSRFRPTA